MKVQGATILVTGANRGLGAAFVRQLQAAGARKIYAAVRDPKSVNIPGVTAVQLDVTKPDSITAAAKQCGDVDIVINNAGIFRGGAALSDDALAAAQAELDANFFGPWLVARAFAPILKRNGGGAIVNVLSVLSWVSLPGSASYSASKAAAWSLTNALRHELQGTQVVAVHVGYMDTDMTKRLDAPKSSPDEVAKQVIAALDSGAVEVFADAISREVKAGLSAARGSYL